MDGGSMIQCCSEAILGHAVKLGSLFGSAYHLVRIVPSPKQFSRP